MPASAPPPGSAAPDDFGDLVPIPVAPRPLWKRVLLVGAVLGCFVLGIIGWLVPIITGVPFYVLGLVLLARVSPALGQRINAWDRGLKPRTRRWLRPTRWREGAGGDDGDDGDGWREPPAGPGT